MVHVDKFDRELAVYKIQKRIFKQAFLKSIDGFGFRMLLLLVAISLIHFSSLETDAKFGLLVATIVPLTIDLVWFYKKYFKSDYFKMHWSEVIFGYLT